MIKLQENSLKIPVARAVPRHKQRASRSGVPIRRDPHSRLMAQLLSLGGNGIAIREAHSRPWASATFVGAQHIVTVEFDEATHDAPKAQAFVNALGETEFSIPGHIVADAAIDGRETQWTPAGSITRLHLIVLTIEDW